jgi:hypothetical protein
VLSPTQYRPGTLVVLNGMLSMPSGRLHNVRSNTQ